MGGLSRKIFQIHNNHKSENENILLLDAGNLLFKRAQVIEKTSRELLTAESIIDIYTDSNFDAVGVGPLDLSGSIDLLKNSSNDGFPWISANLYNKQGEPFFKQWINRKDGDIEIRITALTGSIQNPPQDIVRKEPDRVLPDILKRLTKNHTDVFIILLSTLSNDENKKIAEHYPDINLIIGADPRMANISPYLIHDCLLTQTTKLGKYQGLLKISFGTSRRWEFGIKKPLDGLTSRRDSLSRQIQRLTEKVNTQEENDKYKRTIVRLRRDKTVLDKKISMINRKLEKDMRNGIVGDRISNKFIGLKKNMPTDAHTNKRIFQLENDIAKMR